MPSSPDAEAGTPPLDALRDNLRELGRVLVTFSAGVDSALLAAVAREVLGDDAVALTVVSPTFPPEELELARQMAHDLGIRHVLVDSHELEDERYARNAGDRCYYCKTEMFGLARQQARLLDIPWVVDGTIADDMGDHRPGLRAATEQAVRHPLLDAGFSKAQVRQAAHQYGLVVWDKPAFSCLGSRIPVGTRVTSTRVRQVARVESLLRTLGLTRFRARWHQLEGQPMVRIEVDLESLPLLVQPGMREAIVDVCTAEGFKWVTVDLQGYQRGILSHALSGSETGTPGPR